MAGSPDPKAGRIVDRHLTLCAPRGEGYQGQSPWLVRWCQAEMMRLTDALRAAVKDKIDDRTLRRETRNLISTRLEPVVREANQITKKLLEERWKKFLIGTAKVFRLRGRWLDFSGCTIKGGGLALR